MNKVSHTDTISITITTNYYNNKIRISELDTSSEWNSTAMKRFSSISIDILARFSRTTNS
jgi:hypothetical protein